jgi:hypothetical protein
MDGEIAVSTCISATNQHATIVMPAPLAPGFPQVAPPTRAEYHQLKHQQAQRNAQTKKDALDTLSTAQAKAAHELANIAVPIGITYSLNTLRQSGRLMDGMKLDLSGSSTTLIQQVEKLRASIKEDILKELSTSNITNERPNVVQATAQPPTATTTTNALDPQPIPSNDPHTIPVVPPTSPSTIRRVATVTWGETLIYHTMYQLIGNPLVSPMTHIRYINPLNTL